jgi:Mn2+/Fe2+ NRAMP family transporter
LHIERVPSNRARRCDAEGPEVLERGQLMLSANLLERRLQISAVVLLIGLIVEVLCLFGKGPIAFLLFSGVCVALFLAGILLYLQMLVSASSHHTERQQDDARL